MPHEIYHFLAGNPFFIFYIGIDYAKFALFLERMIAIIQDKQNATKSPYVYSIINWIFQIKVDHLRRPIH